MADAGPDGAERHRPDRPWHPGPAAFREMSRSDVASVLDIGQPRPATVACGHPTDRDLLVPQAFPLSLMSDGHWIV